MCSKLVEKLGVLCTEVEKCTHQLKKNLFCLAAIFLGWKVLFRNALHLLRVYEGNLTPLRFFDGKKRKSMSDTSENFFEQSL